MLVKGAKVHSFSNRQLPSAQWAGNDILYFVRLHKMSYQGVVPINSAFYASDATFRNYCNVEVKKDTELALSTFCYQLMIWSWHIKRSVVFITVARGPSIVNWPSANRCCSFISYEFDEIVECDCHTVNEAILKIIGKYMISMHQEMLIQPTQNKSETNLPVWLKDALYIDMTIRWNLASSNYYNLNLPKITLRRSITCCATGLCASHNLVDYTS